MSAPTLVKVRTIYGDVYSVSRVDLDGTRIQLPIYCSTGIKRCHHAASMNWSQIGHTLHRENIAQVSP